MNAQVVKLRTAGESITLAVQQCRKAERGQYPGVEFIGTDGNGLIVVEVPEKAAVRQLERLGLTKESVVGRTVTISRDENRQDASKPYWGIKVALAIHANGKPPVSNAPELGGPIHGLDDLPDEPPPVDEAYAPAPTNGAAKLDALFNLYDVCFEHAIGIARKAHGLNPDVAAVAATLFIQANQRGIQ